MKLSRQLDLVRNSDPEIARAYRVAADTARFDPFWSPEERAKRAAFYEAEAAKYENAGRNLVPTT